MSVRNLTDAEIEKELTQLRNEERACNKRTKAGKQKAKSLMPRITELALEQGRRWRISLGEPWEGDL